MRFKTKLTDYCRQYCLLIQCIKIYLQVSLEVTQAVFMLKILRQIVEWVLCYEFKNSWPMLKSRQQRRKKNEIKNKIDRLLLTVSFRCTHIKSMEIDFIAKNVKLQFQYFWRQRHEIFQFSAKSFSATTPSIMTLGIMT